jgi:hypothetical protein
MVKVVRVSKQISERKHTIYDYCCLLLLGTT